MNKGQIISGDFTISVLLFIFILILILPLWNYVETQVRSTEDRRDMESSLLIMSDVLTKTSGLPNNWNTTNVRSIGLSDKAGILNRTKVLNLINMDYDSVRNLLGVQTYQMYILLEDVEGYNLTSGVCNSPIAYFSVSEEDVKPVIANSGIIWDYYYGGVSTDQEDSRNFYTGAKASLFNEMLSNRSIYKVMVIEDPELLESEVNIDDLKDFLDLGGIVIFEGDPTLIKDSFGMSSEQGSNRAGVISENGFVLADIGKGVAFVNADWAFYHEIGDKELHTLIKDNNDGKAVVCYWNYGLGRIYYISDIDATVDANPLEFNIIGKRLEFGNLPSGNTIIRTQRLMILNKENNNIANMNVVLWE